MPLSHNRSTAPKIFIPGKKRKKDLKAFVVPNQHKKVRWVRVHRLYKSHQGEAEKTECTDGKFLSKWAKMKMIVYCLYGGEVVTSVSLGKHLNLSFFSSAPHLPIWNFEQFLGNTKHVYMHVMRKSVCDVCGVDLQMRLGKVVLFCQRTTWNICEATWGYIRSHKIVQSKLSLMPNG